MSKDRKYPDYHKPHNSHKKAKPHKPGNSDNSPEDFDRTNAAGSLKTLTPKGSLLLKLLLINGAVIGAAMLVIALLLPQLISSHIYTEKERELLAQGRELGQVMLDFKQGDIDEETALYILDSMDRFLEARIWLADRDGLVFLASQGERGRRQQGRRKGFVVPEPEALEKVQSGEVFSANRYLPHFDETMLTVGVPIKSQANSGQEIQGTQGTVEGALFLHAPVRGIMSTIARMRQLTVMAGIAALLLAALTAIVLSRRFTRPLVEMKNAALKMAGGDFKHRVPATTADEIGQLGTSINQLAAGLERHEANRREFIENVSHELRTPVTTIRGFAEALLDGTVTKPADQRKYLHIISEESQRISKLISDILDLSRLERGIMEITPEPFNVQDAAAAVIAKLHMLAGDKEVNITTDFEAAPNMDTGADPPAEGLIVYADRERIEQVLYILLDNAISFSPVGGQIIVGATKGRERGKINVYVQDDGPGIPAENLPFIWERFYRVEKSRNRKKGGAGLGLSIAGEIINSHGETISAVNSPAGGAVFSFSLPLTTDNA